MDVYTTLLYTGMALMVMVSVRVYAINSCSMKAYYRKQATPLVVVSFLAIVILASCRDVSVGIDTLPFVMIFRNALSFRFTIDGVIKLRSIEPLFAGLNYVIRSHTDNYRYYFTIIYGIMAACIFVFLTRVYRELIIQCNKMDYMVFLPIILAMCYYVHSFNIMRNWFSVSITLIAFLFMAKEKWLMSLFVIIIAGLFHYTAFVFFPIWVVLFIDRKHLLISTRAIMLGVAIGGFVIIAGSTIALNAFFSTTKYVSYEGRVSNWISIAPSLLIALGAIMFKQEIQSKGPIANACLRLVPFRIAFMALNLIGASRSGYFFAFQEIYLISLLYVVIPKKLRSQTVRALVKVLIIAFVLTIYFNEMSNMAESSGVFPYVFMAHK